MNVHKLITVIRILFRTHQHLFNLVRVKEEEENDFSYTFSKYISDVAVVCRGIVSIIVVMEKGLLSLDPVILVVMTILVFILSSLFSFLVYTPVKKWHIFSLKTSISIKSLGRKTEFV